MEKTKTARPQGRCPVCNGTGRTPAGDSQYKTIIAGYNKIDDTFACINCGGQYMYGKNTGQVFLRKDNNLPCVHEYKGENLGRCYNGYTCQHCGDYFTVDSGD